jgi:hypothetical protein
MTAITIYPDTNEVWSSHLAQGLMDGIILVWKHWKWHPIFLLEEVHFKGSVTATNTDQFHFVFEVFSRLNSLIEFVHPERFALAEWSVHVKDFDDDNLRLNLGNSELAAAGKTQIAPGLSIFRHGKIEWRQSSTWSWWFVSG